MKSATGSALLTNIIIVFLVVVMGLLVTSISYTKAYRIKNRIVDIIEDYDGDFKNNKNKIIAEIDASLGSVGYRLNEGKSCSTRYGTPITTGSNYYYCIYENESQRGFYYKVVAYMYLDIPLVGKLVNIPVGGETKVFYE